MRSLDRHQLHATNGTFAGLFLYDLGMHTAGPKLTGLLTVGACFATTHQPMACLVHPFPTKWIGQHEGCAGYTQNKAG